ncbi:sensor histidine kinase [Actinoplanes couchii]|uniref:histidine kinase n=1 Tax=Actinoplanes couchii TaxID=403638 RepID=A0ABQ3XKU4_9ACTN|nr:sensor histidine kinase [Actinoplanes couchii]MDR6319490.1 signal transduction histidine kinase [Actinoplanes couchii]GID59120.1 two-component sensor histidine kinase [Actinoplanes couchii]
MTNVAVAGLVLVLMGADTAWNGAGTPEPDVAAVVLVVLSAVALLFRRRQPIVVAVLCGALLTVLFVLGHRGELLNLAALVGLYTLVRYGDRRHTVVAGTVGILWSALLGWFAEGRGSAPVPEILLPLVAVLIAEVVRGREALAREYADRERRAVADRLATERRTVADRLATERRAAAGRLTAERLRIAREVHDVVAHTLTGVNVQIGVAVAAFDRRPETARDALDQARAAGRDALRELRATVTLLRDPGLDGLPELARSAGSAGVEVTLHCDVPAVCPAPAQLAAYRIVQEALTNVIRHSGATAATVSVTTGDDGTVFVEVIDNGRGPGRAGEGFGLRGMAERAAAVGGTTTSGPAAGGGFRVTATLPPVLRFDDGPRPVPAGGA